MILVSGATGNAAVTSSDHEGRSCRLSGPDSLLPADRDESEIRDTVERVTGRRPRSFEQWANAHGDAFR